MLLRWLCFVGFIFVSAFNLVTQHYAKRVLWLGIAKSNAQIKGQHH